jgi:hypothetical protein
MQELWWVDRMAVGKLNYMKSNIDWNAFGLQAEQILRQRKRGYLIKDGLRKEMTK